MTQDVYLIRHGIAAKRGTYENDEERPLVEVGRQKTRGVAQRLYEIGVRFDVILTSPLVRAKQTARILQQAGLSHQIQEFPPLAPGGDLQDWIKWDSQRYNTLALVGHQPDLGQWAELLVWGRARQKLVIKKAGTIGLRLPIAGSPLGNSELFLLTSVKWLL